MICAHNHVLINRNIQDVYRFVAVNFFDNYPKWCPEVSELEQLTAGDMRVGVIGRQVRHDHGYRSEALFRVTQMTPLRELRFISLSEPDFAVCYLFKPEAAATRLTFDFKLKPTLVMLPFQSLIQNMITRDSRRVVTKLQGLLGAGTEAHTPATAHDD